MILLKQIKRKSKKIVQKSESSEKKNESFLVLSTLQNPHPTLPPKSLPLPSQTSLSNQADYESSPLLTDITNPSFLVSQGRAFKEASTQQKIKAIVFLAVGVPLLFIAIPIALINYFIVQKYLIVDEKKKALSQRTEAELLADQKKKFPIFEATNPIPYDQRLYDLVMYGATGFTGGIAVEYIIQHYLSKNVNNLPFSFAIAGRNKAGLERTLSNALKLQCPTPQIAAELQKKIGIIVADSNNVQELTEMVKQSKSIITTAGPYDKYGTNLVALCAAYGTHLSDITGESDWVRKMIDNYEQQAQETGAILTSHAGHDCLPWELCVLNAANKLKQLNPQQSVVKFDVYDHVSGNISGGTLATIVHSLSGREKYKSKYGFDPLVSYFGEKRTNELKVANQNTITYDSTTKQFIGPFVMASVMGNCIRRSCAINKYSATNSKATYREMFCYDNIWDAIPSFLGLVGLGVGLFIPGVPALMSRILPPGTGPSKEEQQNGYLLIQVIATGDKGDQAESWCWIPKDPGYYYTARMLVETGLVPILNKEELSTLPNYSQKRQNIGGYWTPAAGTGPLIQTRLEDIGIEFVTRQYKK